VGAGHRLSCAARGQGRYLAAEEATLVPRELVHLGLGQAALDQSTTLAPASFEQAEGVAASQGARSPLVGEER
jgi:hypothetical protein